MPLIINYPWVGKPRFDTTGQDIIGPVLMAQKIDTFSNQITFWCPKKYASEYAKILS